MADELRFAGSSASGGRSASPRPGTSAGFAQPGGQASHFQSAVDDLVNAYRTLGHIAARLDPFDRPREKPEPLTLAHHGLSDADLDRHVNAVGLGLAGEVTLRRIIERLEQVYCGTIGVEFMHIADTEQREWLVQRFESAGGGIALDRSQRHMILELLTRSESFERFLGKRYPGDKRFSLEGSESLIPLLEWTLMAATELDAEEIVLGMAHRGRLNVLNNILGKTHQQIFTEFEESWEEDFADGGGDVKYHRGYSGTRRFPNGRMLHLAMASNPSHLESVDAVVEGRCRAKQRLRGDTQRTRVIPLLVHGDAAVIGQGMVFEVLNLSQLEGYTTGGTIHVVVNNHIGFTTVPEDARSSRYCTDIAKAIDAPIFHVNGEDPEACVATAQFALEYRQKFKRDVFIDLWCYRRYGHNEQDEQSFTQPLLARDIRGKTSVLAGYTAHLLAAGHINEADVAAIQHRLDEALEQAQQAARESPNDPTIDPGSARWQGFVNAFSFEPTDTSVSRELLAEVCAGLGRVPEGFSLNKKLEPILAARRGLLESGQISYADAESLAFGTLLAEGNPIRLSGQDVRRGTFSHRHAVIRDVETGAPFIPLNHIRESTNQSQFDPKSLRPGEQAHFCIFDSPLSEQSVLGFEYGYSLADPNLLVLWEAQFGDFVNGAQVIIDQYIASAEAKWGRWSGLVLLLPHGYEGAGPEHSSCRIERFLKLCGNGNMQVIYPSTAAQAFHMFRRQLRRPFRKPLIVPTPKSLLRIPTSDISELMTGTFQEMLDDPAFERDGRDRSKVSRVVLCCGKIYWELDERRRQLGREDIAIVRVEQIYPFHHDLFAQILARYPQSAERVYAQEEPRNAAAYLFVADRMVNEMNMERPRYIGRPASGSPATGSKKKHKYEQEKIVSEAIGPKPEAAEGAGKKVLASA
jgi:2-oxoglutarate dehydrogenase E1 component